MALYATLTASVKGERSTGEWAILVFALFSLNYFVYLYFFPFDEGVGSAPVAIKAFKELAYLAFIVLCLPLLRPERFELRQWIFAPFAGLLIVSSALHAKQTGLSVQLWENGKNALIYLIPYWLCFQLDEDERCRIIQTLSAVIAGSVIVQVLFSIDYHGLVGSLWHDELYVGFLGNPNTFGLILNVATAVCLATLTARQDLYSTIACYAIITVCAIGMVNTASASQFTLQFLITGYLTALLLFRRRFKDAVRIAAAAIFLMSGTLTNVRAATNFVLTPIQDIVRSVEGLPPLDREIEAKMKRDGMIAQDVIRPESISVSARRSIIKKTIGVLETNVPSALFGDFETLSYFEMDGQLFVFTANDGLLTLLAFGLAAIFVYFTSLRIVIASLDRDMIVLHLIITAFGATLVLSRILQYFPLNFLFFLICGLAMSTRLAKTEGAEDRLQVGQIYRLRLPGIAARVIKSPDGRAPAGYPFLMESLFLRSRWYVNDRGMPTHSNCPQLILSKGMKQGNGADRATSLEADS